MTDEAGDFLFSLIKSAFEALEQRHRWKERIYIETGVKVGWYNMVQRPEKWSKCLLAGGFQRSVCFLFFFLTSIGGRFRFFDYWIFFKWAVIKILVICCTEGIILPKYIGIITSHYKDPYEPISIMECHKGLFHVSQMGWNHHLACKYNIHGLGSE